MTKKLTAEEKAARAEARKNRKTAAPDVTPEAPEAANESTTGQSDSVDLETRVKELTERLEDLQAQVSELQEARMAKKGVKRRVTLVPDIDLSKVGNGDAETVKVAKNTMRTSNGYRAQATNGVGDRFNLRDTDGEKFAYIREDEDGKWVVEGYDDKFDNRVHAFTTVVSVVSGATFPADDEDEDSDE